MDLNSKQFKILGSIAISIVGIQIVRKVLPWLYLNFICPKFFGPKIDFRRMGSWAVVTGATDGIGLSYAKELAKKGINLVLISRSLTKLETVAKHIGDAHKVQVKVIDVDFTGGSEIYDKIKKHIEGIDIGVLVNNVGISFQYPEFFLDINEKNPTYLRDVVSANIHSVTHMCQLVLPIMVAKKKGVIINISSTSGVIPNPLMTVYSSTKAFVNKFSANLHAEYESQGITVQSVQPGFVATNMTKIRKPSLFAPSADSYVKAALSTVGVDGQTAGYWPHAIMQLSIGLGSYVMGEQFTSRIILKNLLSTRQRALRNLTKKQ